MTDFIYYTASSIDGFVATESDSLDWLLSQPGSDPSDFEAGAFNSDDFIARIGAVVMGATTYQWILDEVGDSGGEGSWPYAQPTFVFTHRDLKLAASNVRLVSGTADEHRSAIIEAAGDKDVWVVGGGDLAAQFADTGMLDEVIVTYAPVALGSGRPLFTGAHDLELLESGRNGVFLSGRYAVKDRRVS